jgi:hypothetical protein
MALVISEDSALGREYWRWNHTTREVHPSDEDKPMHERLHGMRPAEPLEFPKMLHMARLTAGGQPSTGQVSPDPMHYANERMYELACLAVNTFNQSCCRLVNNPDEQRAAERQGWTYGQDAALAKHEGLQQDIAKAAAEGAYAAKRMGKKAQREYEEAGESTDKHVVDVQPKKRGRKPKAVTA